jgi:hypothetical protein
MDGGGTKDDGRLWTEGGESGRRRWVRQKAVDLGWVSRRLGGVEEKGADRAGGWEPVWGAIDDD